AAAISCSARHLADVERTEMTHAFFRKISLALPLALALSAGALADDHAGGFRDFKRDFSKTEKVVAEIRTHEGVMTFELLFRSAPNTVANFMHLADEGFYGKTTFHRVIQGFMIQG